MNALLHLLVLTFTINTVQANKSHGSVKASAPASRTTPSTAFPSELTKSEHEIQEVHDLQSLYRNVTSDHIRVQHRLREREIKFRANLENQEQQLQAATQQLEREQLRQKKLQQEFEDNRQQIAHLQQQLELQTGDLGEVFGVLRQVASETSGVLETSLIESQFPGRSDIAKELAESSSLPSIKKIEQFWHLLLAEMTESAKIQSFQAKVFGSDGSEHDSEVLRFGPFSLIANGRYLKYYPDTGRIIERERQPGLRHQHAASAFQSASEGQIRVFSIDPTRGAVLDLLVQTPDLEDHIRQSGIIGLLILGLGGLGFAIAGYRWIALSIVSRRVRIQGSAAGILKPREHNPLGRMLLIFNDHDKEQPASDLKSDIQPAVEHSPRNEEQLVLRLESLLHQEVPKLHRGLASIALFAAIAPLLGLLGTVTGMISTFQAITLYGTGDPKLMSGGISQALITTELGLVVAIPLLLLHAGILAKSKTIIQVLEHWNARLTADKLDLRNAPGE